MSPRARLLVVDDDKLMLEHMSALVAEAGYDAVTASSWTEALARFREDKPDLVLLDVVMPTCDGFKLARMLKTGGTSFVPIILLTGLDDVDAKKRGLAAGADDLLTKPVTGVELQIRVASMLRIKQLTDQLQKANAELEALSVTDSLTGLLNRRSLDSHLDREVSRALRHKRSLAVAMADIDHFKMVNDTHGHATGDRVICLVADVLRTTLRKTDFVGRFGGEEFMVVAPETGRGAARMMCERLRAGVAHRSADPREGIPQVTISLGIATSEGSGVITPAELVERADAALYRAKREGRNRVFLAEEG